MKRTRRRVEITTETEEITIRRRANVSKAFCSKCKLSVIIASRDYAPTLANVDANLITRGIEEGKIHAWTANGSQMICVNSLFVYAEPDEHGS